MTYSKSYCEEKEISTSELNEAQRTLYYIAENLKMDNSISEEGYKHFQMAIKALEQEPCEDAVSRQAIIDMTGLSEWFDSSDSYNEFIIALSELPPVTPQPKTGYWIEHPHETGENWEYSKYECSKCHVWEDDDSDFCPNCGARMVEQQESEDKE